MPKFRPRQREPLGARITHQQVTATLTAGVGFQGQAMFEIEFTAQRYANRMQVEMRPI